MNREAAENAVNEFNYYIDRKMEERINAGLQTSDTLAGIREFVKSAEPEWDAAHAPILAEIEAAGDEAFFSLCTYAMVHNSGAIPFFLSEGLQRRGAAAEDFLEGCLDSDLPETDVHNANLTGEQLSRLDLFNSALYLAGEMRSERLFRALIRQFRRCLAGNEMFLERMTAALSREEALPFVRELLEDDSLPDSKLADAMQMLCGMKARSDELFLLMKRGFRRLTRSPQTEIVGAMLLFDYGDPRIIPAMRRLAGEKIKAAGAVTMEDPSVGILLSMIHKMGGRTSDLTGGEDLFR